ncbi:hypothetical protein KKA08_09955, partial [bacterium]|nr:hypothetical protein [bacterium]
MKKLMQNLSIFLAVIVISTIVAEGLIRVIAPQQLLTPEPGIWKYDDAGFLVHLASINTMINHGEGTHHFITDEKGYRINHTATEYSSTSPDLAILGVGDSFLEAVSVENEETLPELIAREIHAKHGTTFYVANNSCSGWSPYYYYIQARNALEERRYDLGIVLLYTGNDIISPTDTSGVPERERHRQKKRAKFGTKSWFIVNILKPGKTWMESHSHLFNLGKRALFMILIREGKTLGDIPFSFYLENSDSDIWEGTTFWCKKLSAEFAKYDTPVCFIIIPNVWQAEEELFDNYLKFANIDPAAVDIDL